MPKEAIMSIKKGRIRVSLMLIPEAMIAPVSGLYDVLNSFGLINEFDNSVPGNAPFDVEIVAATKAPMDTASGLSLAAHRTIEEVSETDIVIIPSIMVRDGAWIPGRYPQLVDWLSRMHERGAMLCSACSGVLLLAETGLLDGRNATIHWAYAPTFRENFPNVHLNLEKILVATGEREQFVMSGASASWHDLALYLVARHVGPTAAQAVAKFMLLQWHVDGQSPYIVFQAPTDHQDRIVLEAQEWLASHFSVGGPVEEMAKRSGLPERSFKRRFTRATDHTPIAYVQKLRVHEAKRRLERTDAPIDEIGWVVGYEDPAFFRRLFKRHTGITPGAYRRKFQLPDFVTAQSRNEAKG
jgi:transcriptional regulator GlxA family with amidase domain